MEITDIPKYAKSLFEMKMFFYDMMDIMEYCRMYDMYEICQTKTSDFFKQCFKYDSQTNSMTYREMITNYTIDYPHESIPYFYETDNLDKRVKCVFVAGLTHGNKYYDLMIPAAIWNSW